MEAKRFAVLTDKPVPNISFGPVVLLDKGEKGTVVGDFDGLEEAKVFSGTYHSEDLRRGWNAGRLRILDRQNMTIVWELKA